MIVYLGVGIGRLDSLGGEGFSQVMKWELIEEDFWKGCLKIIEGKSSFQLLCNDHVRKY